MKYQVPAHWMEVTNIGQYRIVPAINAKCPHKRPSLDWVFYRLMQGDRYISDHGDRRGAMYAVARLHAEADLTKPLF